MKKCILILLMFSLVGMLFACSPKVEVVETIATVKESIAVETVSPINESASNNLDDKIREYWHMKDSEKDNIGTYTELYMNGNVDSAKAIDSAKDFFGKLLSFSLDYKNYLIDTLGKEIEYQGRFDNTDVITLCQDPYFLELAYNDGTLKFEKGDDDSSVIVSAPDGSYTCYIHFIEDGDA